MRALRFAYVWLAGGIGLVALVLYLTLTPADVQISQFSDKFGHFSAFAVLMAWFCGVFELRWAWSVALALLAFGILIELMQGLTTYRSAELADAGFDFMGILFGWGLAAVGCSRWAVTVEKWLPGTAA
jgi:VanZ family protein